MYLFFNPDHRKAQGTHQKNELSKVRNFIKRESAGNR